MASVTSRTGRVELGDGCYAWIAGDVGWGMSNAGLITGRGASLLVDTLYDLRLTKSMLDTLTPLTTPAPISTVVNTHGNGDHWFGNQLVSTPRSSRPAGPWRTCGRWARPKCAH